MQSVAGVAHVYIVFFIYDAIASLTGADRIGANACHSVYGNNVNYDFDWNFNIEWRR